jgi:Kelch motif
MTRRRRQLRLLGPAVLLAIALLLVALAAGGSSGPSSPSGGLATHHPGGPPISGVPQTVAVRLRARRTGMLPAPIEDAATAALGQGRVVLLGGLDAEDTSTAAITMLGAGATNPSGGETSVADTGARLPEAQHDAQGANLGGDVYVFGGGQVESYDHILRFEPSSGRVSVAGHLPQPASDVAVAAIGHTAYIVGGYDGERALDTILAWRPGGNPTVVGRLPAGLRYAAVAATSSRVIIAGGSTASGDASRAILSFDPATGQVTQIGSLPHPLTHASAANIGNVVYVIGGRGSALDSQTAAILAIDPASGRVQDAGALALGLSDAAVAVVGEQIVLAGGQSAGGTQSSIFELTAVSG